MNLSSLFIVCSHGRRSAHRVSDLAVRDGGDWCQGGRLATLEDLGGEKGLMCVVHGTTASPGESTCDAPYNSTACEFQEVLVIPLPQMVAE